LFPWLFCLGLVTSLTSLSAKSIRVAILFFYRGSVVERQRMVRGSVVFSTMLVVILGTAGLLLAWQLVAPLEFGLEVLEKDASQNPLRVSSVCMSTSDATTGFLIACVVLIGLCLVIAALASFWVRNAPEKFHDTKMAAFTGISMLQVFFISIPTFAVVWRYALPRFLVLSSTTFIYCLIILAGMFLPRVWKVRHAGSTSIMDTNAQSMFPLQQSRPKLDEATPSAHSTKGQELESKQNPVSFEFPPKRGPILLFDRSTGEKWTLGETEEESQIISKHLVPT